MVGQRARERRGDDLGGPRSMAQRGRSLMRKVALRVAGLLLLVGLLALPATALAAAPQITITPQEGPNSTLFVVTGVGFTPNTTYYIRIVSADGNTTINFDDPSTTSDNDGVILSGFSF